MGSVGSSPGVGRTIGSSVEGAVVGVAGGFVGLPPPPGVVVAGAGICVLGASVTGAEVGAPETGADVRKSPGPGVPLGFLLSRAEPLNPCLFRRSAESACRLPE